MHKQSFEAAGEGSSNNASQNLDPPTDLVDLLSTERRISQDVVPPAQAPAEAKPLACPQNSTYMRYIDNVARRIYDPALLGNIDELKNKFNCEIARDNDPQKYVRKALTQDPFTSLLNEREFKKMQDQLKGNLVGAGISFRMPTAAEEQSGQPMPLIVQDFEGTANRGLGIQRGDEVIAIDGNSTAGKTWRQGLGMLDGAENSEVVVRVKRDGKEQDVTLKRTKEESPAVDTEMLDGNKFAHVRMKTFMQDDTSAELERAILDHPDAQGYILDLRHNPGGLLNQAFTSASVFISEGKVLTIKDRVPSDPANPKFEMDTYIVGKDVIEKAQNDSQPVQYTQRHPDRVNKPVVVLVDQGTASAAEILAGALKDTDGAYVIGTPTYGKGVGQTIMPDFGTGGALKVTTFQYFTPSGFWPGDGHHKRYGIQPHQFVANPSATDFLTPRDGQLNAAIDYLRTRTPETK